jgi:outer membrane immunogenic protein
MKKLVIALAAAAACSGSAIAADLAARPYVTAPAAVPTASWTGFYVFGGGGGGLWNADSNIVSDGTQAPLLGPAGTPLTRD